MSHARFCLILFALPLFAAGNPDKVRIYVTESGALNAEAAAQAGQAQSSLAVNSGLSPLNTDVMRIFFEQCPDVVAITDNREKADYVVRFDSEGPNPTTPFAKNNKVAVFNRDGDLVYVNSHNFRKTAVRGTCQALEKRP